MLTIYFSSLFNSSSTICTKITTIWSKSTKIKSVQNLLWPSCIKKWSFKTSSSSSSFGFHSFFGYYSSFGSWRSSFSHSSLLFPLPILPHPLHFPLQHLPPPPLFPLQHLPHPLHFPLQHLPHPPLFPLQHLPHPLHFPLQHLPHPPLFPLHQPSPPHSPPPDSPQLS